MNEVLVIIPAYNEEANIGRVVENLIRNHPELDYVIVNDGSEDRTAEICRENGYCLLDLPVNLGLAGAFQAGMKYADRKGYRFAVQFDGDGQHRAEFIGPMREKMEEGYNIVIASRFVTEKKPHSMRMLGSRIIAAAIRLSSGASIADPTSGMRMYDRRMIHLFANQINYPPEPDTVSWLVKNGAKVAEVQAVMDERTGGVSYLTPMNAVRYMTRTLISILFIQSFRVKEKLS
ncbi:MAG: glycosyltransferase family 2 protein [Stomatobaculum sp.]|nr:glycosyltransferase family 2 protein [Stomatobaculum sp.]